MDWTNILEVLVGLVIFEILSLIVMMFFTGDDNDKFGY